ncbi:acyl-CoA reductase [Paenibacillus filicis]|uniref:Acyl-CoA reductase n=1 Tax=Paenibacillus gyeongsangnamensis TaxID=3388067 RepID=A0ABT4QJH6_9BACL|nr:acyl-CoA reductase [Paenibacillus filicis]MCZ8516937.1 acyl-CoA reductase [Paenibacillus filicis]
MKDVQGEQLIRPAYKLPGGIQPELFTERRFQGAECELVLQLPVLTPKLMNEIAHTLRERRKQYLFRLSTGQIVAKLDQAVQKWLDPDYELRRLAEAWLPVITGYDREMIRLELKRLMRTFRKKELLRFLDEEFDNPAVLDEFRPRKNGGLSRAYGPELLFHVFSGNVPGLPVWSLVSGFLLKAANLGKTSSSEPLMPVLFAESLAEVDPELADCMAIVPWKGGTIEIEDTVMEAADGIVIYGGEEPVRQLRQRVSGAKRFVTYGHKVSFAMIGREALTADRYRETARRVAEDASVYDQQGCLSPHSILVEEAGAVTPRQFGQLLAAEMQNYQEKKPRAALSDEESMAIQAVRSRYEMQSLGSDEVAVYTSKQGTDWTVIYHDKTGFEPSPLNRTVHVFRCDTLEEGAASISPFSDYLQTAAVAVGPERLLTLSDELGRLGVTRICAVGRMPRTPAGWHHDGRFNLLDFVRWVDIEASVEQAAEQFDPDVE